ncbi:MAG: hypothetical protein AB4426_16005 [Xenococcaceae cyanobacterium]
MRSTNQPHFVELPTAAPRRAKERSPEILSNRLGRWALTKVSEGVILEVWLDLH